MFPGMTISTGINGSLKSTPSSSSGMMAAPLSAHFTHLDDMLRRRDNSSTKLSKRQSPRLLWLLIWHFTRQHGVIALSPRDLSHLLISLNWFSRSSRSPSTTNSRQYGTGVQTAHANMWSRHCTRRSNILHHVTNSHNLFRR